MFPWPAELAATEPAAVGILIIALGLVALGIAVLFLYLSRGNR